LLYRAIPISLEELVTQDVDTGNLRSNAAYIMLKRDLSALYLSIACFVSELQE
jgi:hypothetical protein